VIYYPFFIKTNSEKNKVYTTKLHKSSFLLIIYQVLFWRNSKSEGGKERIVLPKERKLFCSLSFTSDKNNDQLLRRYLPIRALKQLFLSAPKLATTKQRLLAAVRTLRKSFFTGPVRQNRQACKRHTALACNIVKTVRERQLNHQKL
jgi:hypothetical protein